MHLWDASVALIVIGVILVLGGVSSSHADVAKIIRQLGALR